MRPTFLHVQILIADWDCQSIWPQLFQLQFFSFWGGRNGIDFLIFAIQNFPAHIKIYTVTK